ncbi:MAG: hypothetical protein SF162_17030 [bacterium]|nr:hypothetical protein [bacterium]
MTLTNSTPAATALATLAAQFCERVNVDLSPSHADQVIADLKRQHPEHADQIDAMGAALAAARTPADFYTESVELDDAPFEQTYEMLRRTFLPAELEPRERYREMIDPAERGTTLYPLVLVGTFWRTPGICRYDEQSALTAFDYDPLGLRYSAHVQSVVNSNYMRLPTEKFTAASFGAIGHTAPYPPTREVNLGALQAFEARMVSMAQERGDTFRLFMVEADADCAEFFYEAGYRQPKGSYYEQPPLEFDCDTGKALHQPVPQTLMVKAHNPQHPDKIETDLLKAAVRVMVEQWCLFGLEECAGFKQAKAQIERLLLAFDSSLPKDVWVDLVEPDTDA